ncbi:MAG: DUF4861 family protein [Opitutae bacterium]|nr:DUF4861 family protein [Opitutae bacterium]
MKKLLLTLFVSVTLVATAAEKIQVTVMNSLPQARRGEVVVIPFREIRAHFPTAPIHNLVVRNAATGVEVPSQTTNFNPDDRRALCDDFLFQYDFAAGEKSAQFTIEAQAEPVPPYPARVFARYVPDRLDDFAWENDRIAHRVYGPRLDSPAAGGSRMISSGIDVWCKRVPYLIVDRWYNKGHNAYHTDTGEGLDTYSVGTGRGCGGTGVWDGEKLHVSHNWQTWKILANGPLRTVFELTYAPWDAGAGVKVSEVKRFTVDAGRNLDMIESTFTVQGGSGEITVAVGIVEPPDAKLLATAKNEAGTWLSLWQEYPKAGQLGCGVVLAPEAAFAGFAAGKSDPKFRNQLVLAKVKTGQTLRYFAGAGWNRSGLFATQADWEAYLADFARRLRAPIAVNVPAAK